MLGYLARSLPTYLRARLGRDRRRVSRISRRVRLTEIDINGHMNQAVYAQVTELGRLDWVVRSGAWADFRSQGISAVVAEQRLIYRRELKPFTRYTIDTRAVGFDGRLAVFESHLMVGDRVHAKAEGKLIFLGPGGVLAAEEVHRLAADYLSPPLAVAEWRVLA